MEMKTKVARYGNSLTVRLPAALAREANLREGDQVTLRKGGGGITIERSKRSRLAARLATVQRGEAEVGAGRAVGAESLE